jgi:hypothetical protein
MASPSKNNASETPIDALFLHNLMDRLQLRPPFLDSNSFLTSSLEDLHLLSNFLPDSDADSDPEPDIPLNSDFRRRALAKEETKLEKEVIRLVQSGDSDQLLKPNTGQSVSIGDHNICVGFHVDKEAEYRVWEWHGHIMLYDETEGYIYDYLLLKHSDIYPQICCPFHKFYVNMEECLVKLGQSSVP